MNEQIESEIEKIKKYAALKNLKDYKEYIQEQISMYDSQFMVIKKRCYSLRAKAKAEPKIKDEIQAELAKLMADAQTIIKKRKILNSAYELSEDESR